ncbi:VOC family protein [Desemzia sp. FAM 23991]|uniref:VOC family protein n=1 Tax=unclassified Desemzia TaxID=2685243 RepID=UPI003888C923
MITGIHHISAITKSSKKNHAFYVDLLGLRFVKNTVNQQNTAMRHLFYGDYNANPGTQLTFFELKNSGRAYNEDNYFSTITLDIPKGSLSFWKDRLAKHEVSIEHSFDKASLFFKDEDGMPLALRESESVITADNAVSHSSIPREMQIIGLSEVLIRVVNPEATLDFLTSFLGLQREVGCNYVYNPSNQFTTTVEASNNTNKSRLGHGSMDHIAYSVNTVEDLETLHQKALDMNLPIELYLDRDYFKSLYVTDPNGLRIEIATKGPGFTIDESLESLATTLALPSFLENKRAEIEAQLEEF